jgi:hypothetical protein
VAVLSGSPNPSPSSSACQIVGQSRTDTTTEAVQVRPCSSATDRVTLWAPTDNSVRGRVTEPSELGVMLPSSPTRWLVNVAVSQSSGTSTSSTVASNSTVSPYSYSEPVAGASMLQVGAVFEAFTLTFTVS